MKKWFTTIIILLVLTVGIVYCTRSEKFMNKFVKDIDVEDIKINDLGMKNCTFHYNNLTDEQKKIYRVVANGVIELKKSITVDVTKDSKFDKVKNDIEIALNAFLADHPEVFYVDDRYEIALIDGLAIKILKLNLNYATDNKKELKEMEEKIQTEITSISSKLSSYKNDYEKELLIHDLIATNVDYYDYSNYDDIPTIKHTAYGALVDRSAVCDGITKAFQLVLAKNNIESIFVTGEMDGVSHAWCKVQLDNSYYNVDVTSDKTLNKENKNLVVHAYLNITDEEILNTHSIDKNEKLPSCTNTKYNYYLYNDYTIGTLDNFEYKLKEIINKQQGKFLLEINTSGVSNVPEKLVQALYNLNFNRYKQNNVTKVQYNKINNNYIVIK